MSPAYWTIFRWGYIAVVAKVGARSAAGVVEGLCTQRKRISKRDN
ncbi:hypothetical protein I41_56080 (plasmid) [Lacipirellula limnantheis]|uniref:Uncharacterized protein n=1 Tax=Lacipirellula limnantheis TaxID=2528024 RepID=A0A517U6U9_9BACT|nr:hypothetical protein I41_56080 [Lacipirellula limnantheis]